VKRVKSLRKRILIAPLCSISISPARDPYVERLFEGFAFLMGRLREKLDDDLPELTEGW
jgi:type VI secretion system protein ImpG